MYQIDYINNIFTLFVSTKTYIMFNLFTKLTHTAFISAIIVVVVTAIVVQALTAVDKQKSYFLGEMCVTFTYSLKYIEMEYFMHIKLLYLRATKLGGGQIDKKKYMYGNVHIN